MTKPHTPTHTELFVLTIEQYQALEKKASPLYCTEVTTSTQMTFAAGQQSILKHLREGFTIGR